MATPRQHARTIDNTINQIRGGVFDNLKQLEERIAELVLLGADPAVLDHKLLRSLTDSKITSKV